MAFTAYTNEWAAQWAVYQLGIKATVSDVTTSPSTSEEVVLNNLLQPSIRKVVSSYDWAFLRKRVVLTEDTTADIEGWDYVYDIPADFEKIIRLEPTDQSYRGASEAQRVAFDVDYDITGADRKLVTDIANAEMVYVQQITSLNTAPGNTAPFYVAEAIAAEMASQAAMPLLSDMNVAARSMALAKEKLEEAIAIELNTQQQPDDWPEADAVIVRY